MRNVDDGFLAAVRMGERNGIQKWLNRGASLHAVDKRGQTALMLCRRIELFDWLVGEGVSMDARDKGGRTVLFEAAVRDDPRFVRLLLEHGADLHARSHDGRTALFEAAVWHKPGNVRLLLDHGAAVNVRRSDGGTPLMHAAWPFPEDAEAVETLQLLLSHGADVNAVDEQGKTALIHLFDDARHRVGHAEIARLLLAHHAEPGIVDSDGDAAVGLSLQRGLDDVVALLKQQVRRWEGGIQVSSAWAVNAEENSRATKDTDTAARPAGIPRPDAPFSDV